MANAMLRSATSEAVFFESLPISTRKKLRISDLGRVTGTLLIKDRQEQYFHEDARKRTELRRFKRSHGFCVGELTCLTYVGKESESTNKHWSPLCGPCQKIAAKRRKGEVKYHRSLSEYGKMRAKERADEKAERERLAGGGR